MRTTSKILVVLTSSVISLNVFMCVCEDENTSKHPRHDRVKKQGVKTQSDSAMRSICFLLFLNYTLFFISTSFISTASLKFGQKISTTKAPALAWHSLSLLIFQFSYSQFLACRRQTTDLYSFRTFINLFLASRPRKTITCCFSNINNRYKASTG